MLLSGCTDSAREARATVSPARTQREPSHTPPLHELCCHRAGCSLICLHPATNRSSSSLTLTRPYLIGSKLYSCFPFHQSCADLHNHRLDGVRTAPALRDRVPHNEASADGTPAQGLHLPTAKKGPSRARQRHRESHARQLPARGTGRIWLPAGPEQQEHKAWQTAAATQVRAPASTHLFCK